MNAMSFFRAEVDILANRFMSIGFSLGIIPDTDQFLSVQFDLPVSLPGLVRRKTDFPLRRLKEHSWIGFASSSNLG